MGFNDESLSDKILRLTDATSGALNQVVTGNYQTNAAKSEYQLKKSKYLHDLDNNVYTTSAQKALKGIESMFYGNSKTGVNGFFKDQLNDMNYEGYELGTTSMLENTLTADYLMKNFGMTATHAERFIDEYADTITAEAMQRTQTNTWMAMTSQLGTDQKSYTALMAETGNSVTEQYAKVSEHYNSNGGPSWDLTGEYNPDRIENKLQFGYDWSISTGKSYVDTNLGKTGITLEQIVEGALGYFDNAMNEMGDGSNQSNATISASREEFEKYIRSYISAQSGYMYTESQDKARNASNALVQIQLDGNYVDKEHFEEILTDAGLSRDNVYDLSFILEFQNNLFGGASATSKTVGSSPEVDLSINNFYNNYFNRYDMSNDDCYTAVAMMEARGEIGIAQASALRNEIASRSTFATENFSRVSNTLEDHLYMSMGDDAKPILFHLNNDPSMKSQIYKTLASHPEWNESDIFKYAMDLSVSFQNKELGNQIDNMLSVSYGEATGYETKYNISNEDAYTVRAGIYSGKYTHLLRPEYSERIMSSIANGQFSSEEDLENSVSMMMFGKDASDLSGFEKSILQANIIVNALNAKEFSNVTTVLGEINQIKNTEEDYRMVDVYSFGAGATSGDKVYFIDSNGYLNIMRMEVGDNNWNNLQENNGSYGAMVDPSTLHYVGKINLKNELKIIGSSNSNIVEEEEPYNAFGPLMKQTTNIVEEAKEEKENLTLANRLLSKEQPPSLHDIEFDFPLLSTEKKSELSMLLTAMQFSNTGKAIGGPKHESR